jgi:hypothetical protein
MSESLPEGIVDKLRRIISDLEAGPGGGASQEKGAVEFKISMAPEAEPLWKVSYETAAE